MFRRAITRRILVVVSGKCGSLQEELRGEAETFLEADSRLPAEELARPGDVGPRVADVAGPLGLIVALDRAAEQRADRLGQLVNACRPAGRDVQDGAGDAFRLGRAHVRFDDVLDVREV